MSRIEDRYYERMARQDQLRKTRRAAIRAELPLRVELIREMVAGRMELAEVQRRIRRKQWLTGRAEE